MGVDIKQRGASFQLNTEHFEAALAAIKATEGPLYHDRDSPVQSASTLETAFEAWCWKVTCDEHSGDIVSIQFKGQYANNDELLFNAIAPYVTSGSWIEMASPDGLRFRYNFEHGEMREIYPRVSWPGED